MEDDAVINSYTTLTDVTRRRRTDQYDAPFFATPLPVIGVGM
jgi:hypothetical protein